MKYINKNKGYALSKFKDIKVGDLFFFGSKPTIRIIRIVRKKRGYIFYKYIKFITSSSKGIEVKDAAGIEVGDTIEQFNSFYIYFDRNLIRRSIRFNIDSELKEAKERISEIKRILKYGKKLIEEKRKIQKKLKKISDEEIKEVVRALAKNCKIKVGGKK